MSGCGNGGASEPPVTSYDPAATSKLQLAVGVATLSDRGRDRLRTQRSRDAAPIRRSLRNALQRADDLGPTSFLVLTSTETGGQVQNAGNDLGTNHITWATLNQWSFAARSESLHQWSVRIRLVRVQLRLRTRKRHDAALPVVYAADLRRSLGVVVWRSAGLSERRVSLRNLGWEGYSLGFTDFAVQPVIGTYHLYAAVPPAYDTPQNPTPSPGPNGTPTPAPGILAAGALLTSLKPLPVFDTPTFVPDRKGGGTIGVDVPAGAHEVMAVVRALGNTGNKTSACNRTSTDAFYTVVTHRAGKQKVDAWPMTSDRSPNRVRQRRRSVPGRTTTSTRSATDYPAYEASYPKNLSQLPPIKGPNGQADVSTSDTFLGLSIHELARLRKQSAASDCGDCRARVDGRLRRNANTPDGPYVGTPGGGGRTADTAGPRKSHGHASGRRSRSQARLSLVPTRESFAIQLASVNGNGVTGVNPTIINTVPKSATARRKARNRVYGDGQRLARTRRLCRPPLTPARTRAARCSRSAPLKRRSARGGGSFGVSNRHLAYARRRRRFAEAKP